MGKTLGINHDKWHMILAVLVVAVVFTLLWSFTNKYLYISGTELLFVICMVISIAVAHYLQCWNESWQMRDPRLLYKYTSFGNFVTNSRKDFRYFWTGIVFSWPIPVIIVFIFHP